MDIPELICKIEFDTFKNKIYMPEIAELLTSAGYTVTMVEECQSRAKLLVSK